MYPASIKPTPHKKRKQKESYCQRLARNLDHFDQHPHIWLNDWYNTSLPPIFKLPPELRQSILSECIEDAELYAPRPNLKTQTLSLVCKVFARDVQATKTIWDAREQELRGIFGFEKTAFTNYISDLMGPIKVASAALSAQTSLKHVQLKKEANNRSYKCRRVAEKTGSGTNSESRRKRDVRTERVKKSKHARTSGKSEYTGMTVDEICAMMTPGYINKHRAERFRLEQKQAEIMKLEGKRKTVAQQAVARKELEKALYVAELERCDTPVGTRKKTRALVQRTMGKPIDVRPQGTQVRRIEVFEQTNSEWIIENPEQARVKMRGLNRRCRCFSSLSEALSAMTIPGGRVEVDFNALPLLKEAYGDEREFTGIHSLLKADDVDCIVREPMREIAAWREKALA